jgi:hypothetical protein
MQPNEYQGQLPDVPNWATDDTPTHMVSQRQPADWRDTRLVRFALGAFCVASVVASASIVVISVRVVWAVWPK